MKCYKINTNINKCYKMQKKKKMGTIKDQHHLFTLQYTHM